MFYNVEKEENSEFTTDEEIQKQGLDKVIEEIYVRNGATEEYAEVKAPPKEKIERKIKEKKEKRQKVKKAKEEEKQRQEKLKEVEKEIQEKQGDITNMGKKEKEKVNADLQIIIALYLGCIIMVGLIFLMIKLLK